MHDAGASRAKPPQAAKAASIWPELDLVESWSSRFLAPQAEEPARSARLLSARTALLQKLDQVSAADDRGVAALHNMQSLSEPMPDRGGCRARDLAGLSDVVRAQAFDPLRRVSAVRHRA